MCSTGDRAITPLTSEQAQITGFISACSIRLAKPAFAVGLVCTTLGVQIPATIFESEAGQWSSLDCGCCRGQSQTKPLTMKTNLLFNNNELF